MNIGLPFALMPSNPGGVDTKLRLLPEDLADAGYINHLVGKWHLGQGIQAFHPLRRGFHSFYGLLGGGFNFYTKQVHYIGVMMCSVIFFRF